MFRKNEFLDYVRENYFVDVDALSLLEGVVMFAEERFGHQTNGVTFCVEDILSVAIPITFQEIAQFED